LFLMRFSYGILRQGAAVLISIFKTGIVAEGYLILGFFNIQTRGGCGRFHSDL